MQTFRIIIAGLCHSFVSRLKRKGGGYVDTLGVGEGVLYVSAAQNFCF